MRLGSTKLYCVAKQARNMERHGLPKSSRSPSVLKLNISVFDL